MGICFGPAGNAEQFYEEGGKSSAQIPKWLFEKGLNAYEYQCGKGVLLKETLARKIGEEAQKYDIELSIHAPYFISLSSVEKEKRENSIHYILDSLQAASFMGAKRIVVHSGSCAKQSREEALSLASQTLAKAVKSAKEHGYGDIFICPETMGKINQLGTLEEVLELCTIDETLLPAVDFGHLNARTLGGLKTFSDFQAVFEKIENRLGSEKLKKMHIHFSKIEYSAGGEKRHLTFEDEIYGPEFTYIARILYQKKLEPVVICESAGTQAKDALTLKNMYEAEALQ